MSLSDVPVVRLPRQYYIYWNVEAPLWLWLDRTDLGDLQSFFNWSMGYRLDADFPVPYGALEQVTIVIIFFYYQNNPKSQNTHMTML